MVLINPSPKKTFLFVLGLFLLLLQTQSVFASNASPDGLLNITDIPSENNFQQTAKMASTSPSDAQLILDAKIAELSELLNSAPLLDDKKLGVEGANLYLPLSDGEYTLFEVFKNPIIKTKSNSQNIQTFKAFSVEDQSYVAHIDIGSRGFHAMIQGNGQTFFIDPEQEAYKNSKITPSQHFGFNKKNINTFVCETQQPDSFDMQQKTENKVAARTTGNVLREYDIAVVASPSYSGAFTSLADPVKADVFSGIVTAINRVNLVFNQDLAINLVLLEELDLIFTDPEDPSYPFQNNMSLDISLITGVINNTIGAANYDIGHMLTSSNGGLAFLGVVCNNNSKGRGITGTTDPDYLKSEFFAIDYIAHELGHQFGANHTFNATSGSCQGSRNAFTAVEPGSGTTVMAYAGICGSQNLQAHSDPYFHATSINEILDYVETQNCSTDTATGDSPPQISSTSGNQVIPSKTPFFLNANASDLDGSDIFFSWEQTDKGNSTNNFNSMQSDSGSNPLFRSLISTANQSTRYFPAFANVIQNTTMAGETFATRTRELNFTLSVRSQPYGRNSESLTLDVIDTEQGFLLLHPSADSVYQANEDIEIKWDTGDTEQNPVSCNLINMFYSSTNSQNPADYVLISENILNDGSHIISGLNTTNNARLLLACADNIFYSVGTGKFILSTENTSYFFVHSSEQQIIEGNSTNSEVNITISRTGNLSQTSSVDFQLNGFGTSQANTLDYTTSEGYSGSIIFNPDESNKIISVSINADTIFEQDESFEIQLINPDNGYISQGFTRITIINDDTHSNNDDEDTEINEDKDNQSEIIPGKKSSGGSLNFLYFLNLLTILVLKKKSFLIGIVVIVIFSCTPIKEKPAELHPQVQNLVWVEHANAKQDVERNFAQFGKKSYFHAIALRGHIEIPGLVEEELEQAIAHGYQIQEGMGDVIFNDQHMRLREQFFIYASEYNQLLAKKLF